MRERNIRRSIHNFRLLVAGAGRQGRRPGGAGGLLQQRVQGVRRPGREPARVAAGAPGRPAGHEHHAWPRSTELGNVLGPTLGALRPGARALGPALVQTRPFLRPDDADHPEPAAAVRSRGAAGGQGPAARPRATWRRSRRSSPRRSRCSTTCSTSWPTTRRARRRATSSGRRGPATPARPSSPPQDAHGPIRHGLVLASCSTLQVLRQLSGPVPQLGTLGEPAQRARPGGGVPDDQPGRRGADAAQPGEEPLDAEAGSQPRSHPGHGGLRALVLRAAALPVARLRRPDPAAAEGLPLQRGLQRGRHAVARRPTCGSPASRSARSRSSTPTRRPAPPTRRSSSTPRTRRSPRTPRRSCARRRCWARPTSS